MPLFFESRATGSVLMTQGPAQTLLGALGRMLEDGSIPNEGVFTVEQLPQVIAKLEVLIEKSKQQQEQSKEQAQAGGKDAQDHQAETIGLHQRAWPLLEQCRRSLAANKPVTWRKA